MKRMHVHISVDNIDKSIAFYSAMLGEKPSVLKPDYAKWALGNPRLNLAISQRGINPAGVNHLGIQAESDVELKDLYENLGNARIATMDQKGAKCCYAESNKHWAVDPSGVAWEMFHTMGEIAVFGSDSADEIEQRVERTITNKNAVCCS